MFNYSPENQLSIFDFKTQFETKLDPQNRWVKLANLLNWDALAKIYATTLSSDMGAKSIDARVALGTLIIKHLEKKDDRGTIEIIQENPYMQYFLGFDSFQFKAVFDPSLLVHIRKRLDNEAFDKMNQIVILQAIKFEDNNNPEIEKPKPENDDILTKSIDNEDIEIIPDTQKPTNSGKLQMDATVCDAHIKYPTDLNLLNGGREKSEQIIDSLCQGLSITKPRTYRIQARKSWINLSKSKKNSKKKMRKGLKQQLNYVKRNLKSIDTIIENHSQALSKLDKHQYRYLLIVSELYRQQLEMHQENKHSIAHRIVSIHQPHVRPIVRGKSGKNVEFGAKINVSLENGYARIDQFNFEAFNEGTCMIEQLENYNKLHGYYPELAQVDAIYLTRENRKFMKDNHIRHIGKPLGRKSNQEISKKEKLKQRQETNERNHIESKFGQGKSAYGLNKIMAKLDSTTQSWIASIFFVMNILKLSKDILCLIKTHLLSLKFGIKMLKSNLIFLSSTLQYPKVYTITYIGK